MTKVVAMTPKELRELRAYLGIRQNYLAARMGVPRQTVTRWEAKPGKATEYRIITRHMAYAILNTALVIAYEQGRKREPIHELFAAVNSRT